jgi:ankyrin repeat protein
MAIIRRNQEEVTRILETSPHSVKERNVFGQTPLHLSCSWAIGVQLLLNNGGRAIIDIMDEYGMSALFNAIEFDSLDCVGLLLEADCCLFPSEPKNPALRTLEVLFKALLRASTRVEERICRVIEK